MKTKDILNKCITVLISIATIFMITACSGSSSGGFEDDFGTEAGSETEECPWGANDGSTAQNGTI